MEQNQNSDTNNFKPGDVVLTTNEKEKEWGDAWVKEFTNRVVTISKVMENGEITIRHEDRIYGKYPPAAFKSLGKLGELIA